MEKTIRLGIKDVIFRAGFVAGASIPRGRAGRPMMSCLIAGFVLTRRGSNEMTELSNDREARIVDAASECESDASLARVTAGIVELLAQRGSSAWEALQRQIAASSQRDEITHQLSAILADLEIEALEEELGEAAGEIDERLDPEDGVIETGEEDIGEADE